MSFQINGFMSDKELAAFFKISRVSVWRWAREGRLPAPRKLGPNTTRWDADEVREVLAKIKEGTV
jgi:predicted DNA-binding transcriptional regulator AlpA